MPSFLEVGQFVNLYEDAPDSVTLLRALPCGSEQSIALINVMAIQDANTADIVSSRDGQNAAAECYGDTTLLTIASSGHIESCLPNSIGSSCPHMTAMMQHSGVKFWSELTKQQSLVASKSDFESTSQKLQTTTAKNAEFPINNGVCVCKKVCL